MTMASVDDRTRRIGVLDRPLALQVILLERTYVLPWSQFLYAEGGNDEVRLIFATHDVLVKGSNLNALLAAISAHGLALVQEPARPDKFSAGAGPFIREIAVKRIEQDQA
jgi:hypothetical protein